MQLASLLQAFQRAQQVTNKPQTRTPVEPRKRVDLIDQSKAAADLKVTNRPSPDFRDFRSEQEIETLRKALQIQTQEIHDLKEELNISMALTR